MTAFSIKGTSELGLDMRYASGMTEDCGELGYGWYHDYEMYLEQKNGVIEFYLSPGQYVSFVNKNALEMSLYGSTAGNQTILSEEEKYFYGECVCFGAVLFRYCDGCYSDIIGIIPLKWYTVF